MKLYYSPGACSLSPHIVAREAGVALDLVKVDLKTHKTANGEDYYTLNPKGYVPALELDDGKTLTEGPAIVQYLADLKPESHLAPASGTFARYKLQEWLTFINGELHKPFGVLFGSRIEEAKTEARAKIGKRFAFVEKELGDRAFLAGDNFTVADAYLFVMLTWAHDFKVDLKPYPKLAAWFARVSARPNVRKALQEEGLAK
jgi:glutathione S-transferase